MPVEKPEATNDWIGGAWLESTYGLELVMPLRVVSRIGGRRSTSGPDDIRTETFVATMRPTPTWRGHLTFHLKHEAPHLELLARLFEELDGGDVADWDGAIPESVVLPVSATITRNPAQRRAYDAILDDISRPLMRVLAGRYAFTAQPTRYPDGISSNFVCQGAEAVLPAWRLPDLSRHVIYLAQLLQQCIREDMREESRYLRNHGRARHAIKEIIEMPDHQIDRVIRSAQVNHGRLSRVLAKEIPALATPGIWELIRKAIQEAFQGDWPGG